MSNPLKELLERLGIDANHLLSCKVQQSISNLQDQICKIPLKEDSDQKLVEFVLGEIRLAAKFMIKEAKKRELEFQIKLLDKPDNMTGSSEEEQHTAQHLDEEQLSIDLEKRKGEAFLRFADLISSWGMEN